MSRKTLRWLLTGAGITAFALLLRQFGVSSIVATVARVGWAFPALLALQAVSELLNAAGWRLCFPAGAGALRPAFPMLVRLRLAGDGINYLVPTATIGGELLRIDLLDPDHALADRTSSVVLARIAQDVALASLAAAGFGLAAERLLIRRDLPSMIGLWPVPAAAALAAGIVGAMGRWLSRQEPGTRGGRLWSRIKDAIAPAAARLRDHPVRFSAAVVIFGAGYVWGAVEAFWICRLIGRPVSAGTAVRIEVLSLTVDAIVFLVPARIGTQEAGKALIFTLLGLPPSDGFAFGVIRHVRELTWAGIGLVAAAKSRRN